MKTAGDSGRWYWTAVLVVLGVVVLAIGLYGPYWRVASSVTPAAIRAIRVVMSQDEVTAILGQPLQARTWGPGGTILDSNIHGLHAP